MTSASSSSQHHRAGLREIAALAGVSIGSVSSVLNNRHVERRIPDKTAETIRKVAAQLGYLPNISARRLRSGTVSKNSLLLALITSFEAPTPLIQHFLAAFRPEAQAGNLSLEDYECSLMVEMFSAGQLRKMRGLLTGDHFNAAIILNTVPEDDQFLATARLPYPAVLVNRSIADYASVVEEELSGARPAEVFAQIGRQKLAVMHNRLLTQITRRRTDTFVQRAAELTGREALTIRSALLSEQEAYEAMRDFLRSGQRCDALYCISDALALGAYRAIKEAGLSIPGDIAVVGVGDYTSSAFMDPPLTCIGVAHSQLAEQASRLLTQLILKGGRANKILHVPTLESLRASTGH